MKTLTDLHKKIHVCTRCLLSQTVCGKVVGSGYEKAHILIIGEAPGKTEDETGEPFVGASGKILNELLYSIGCMRSDVFITNIIKCRPPKNRDPSAEEINTCLVWLIQQIGIIQPKVIITLGRHALKILTQDSSDISLCHGTILSMSHLKGKNIIILPLYHPAASIYNRKLRRTLFEDIQKLPDLLI